jgi:hypothetical protein
MSAGSFHHLQASRKQWWLVMVTGALTLICGSLGLWQYEHDHGQGEFEAVPAAVGALYHAIQMLILHTPHFEHGTNLGIELGRWFGAFTLVTTTVMLLWRRLRREFQLFQLTSWTGHHVVCGLGRKGLEVARFFKLDDPDAKVVVIDPNPDEHSVHECEAVGICVLTGDATDERILGRTRVQAAAEIIVITPEDETNVRIATKVRKLVTGSTGTLLRCYVHLANIHLRDSLQRLAEGDGQKQAGCKLHFFDVYDNEARRVLLTHSLDGTGIRPDAPTSVHVVILGFGRMGRSLALRAAKMGHFANRKLLRVSMIDRNAPQQEENLLFHYPALVGGKICQLKFHHAAAQSLAARQLIEKWSTEPDTVLHIFVCLDTNAEALEVSLRLREALVARGAGNLFVRIKSHASLADILELKSSIGPRIIPFGMVEDACCNHAFRQEYNEAIARAIHEEFTASRLADSSRRPENDPALRPWEDLREELRESNRQQADHIAIKLRALGCELAESSDPRPAVMQFDCKDIELLSELEHTRWNTERWLAGWRYGTPSDKNIRINEYLVAWNELHDSIKKYDRDTVTKIPALLVFAKPPLKVVRQVRL